MKSVLKAKFSIILDTDIIVAEQFLRSPTATAVLKGAEIIGAQIIIPEVVLDEVLGIYSQRLEAAINHHHDVGAELAGLIRYNPSTYRFKEEFEAYKNWLFEQIRLYEIKVVKYPHLTLKELVIESYIPHRLFEKNPDGHTDYLLWKTIVAYLATQPEVDAKPSYFLTSNKKVFCRHAEGEWNLRESLRVETGRSEEEFNLVFSLKDIFTSYIKPKLPGGVVEEIDVIYYIQSRFDEELDKIVQEQLTDKILNGIEGIPLDELHVNVVSDILVDEISWTKLSDQQMHVSCWGTLELEVEGWLSRNDYWAIDREDDDIYMIEMDAGEKGARAGCPVETSFEFVAIYDRQQARLINFSLMMTEEMKPENYR